MAHERTYDPADATLAQLRSLALALPESTEVEAWGRPTFRAGKMFAVYGRTPEDGANLIVKPDPEDLPGLRDDGRFYVPPYFKTWLALDLDDTTDWLEVNELLDASYRQVAPKRLTDRLEGS
ncbi:MAG: MmcQ/YjbR family DNA-binding protein [Actinobacteria bacterium]|nr:MmcQ/YjbR family DNA-binding protein [Actinomycetota bacterium]